MTLSAAASATSAAASSSTSGAPSTSQSERFDVVVLGTGAAGLTAALAAHDARRERRACSRRPNRSAARRPGRAAWCGSRATTTWPSWASSDSRDDVLTYLASLSHGHHRADLAAAYVDAGPEMVRWLEARTPVQFHDRRGLPRLPPRASRRQHRRRPVAGVPAVPVRRARRVGRPGDGRPQSARTSLMSETTLGRGDPQRDPAEELARRRDPRRAGAAGRPRRSAAAGRASTGASSRGPGARRRADRRGRPGGGVRVRRPDGDVRGRRRRRRRAGHRRVRVERGARARLPARADDPPGVGADQHRRRAADGDAGRRLARQHARGVVGADASTCPTRRRDARRWLVNGERTRPHCIMVNRAGRRFANEAANYNAFGAAFHEMDVDDVRVRQPARAGMIFDHDLPDPLRPGRLPRRAARRPTWMARRRHHRRAGRGDRRRRRAALGDTVDRWNGFVGRRPRRRLRAGRQRPRPLVGRPDAVRAARATLGPIDAPPYYAVEVHSGALGTKGGPAHRRPTARCSTSTARRSPASTPPATSMASPDGHDLRRRRRHARARRWCSATSAAATPPVWPARPARFLG